MFVGFWGKFGVSSQGMWAKSMNRYTPHQFQLFICFGVGVNFIQNGMKAQKLIAFWKTGSCQIFGQMIQFDQYFSDGLKSPTRKGRLENRFSRVPLSGGVFLKEKSPNLFTLKKFKKHRRNMKNQLGEQRYLKLSAGENLFPFSNILENSRKIRSFIRDNQIIIYPLRRGSNNAKIW